MAFSGLLPDPPEPPNPIQTAAAQTGTNVSTAIANSYLGNVNQSTPQGNLNYDVTSNFNYTDPTTGQSFSIPRWTATQTLSPAGQATQTQSEQAQLNLARMANQQSSSLGNLLGTPFNSNLNIQQYLRDNPDVAAAARNTPLNTSSGNFNAQAYLAANPDVAAAGMDPWQHYQQFGQREGRQFTPILGQNPMEFAARHYQQFGMNEGRAGGMPGMGDINWLHGVGGPQSTIADTPQYQSGYASGGDIARGYGTGGDITRSYGPQDNYGADRQRIEAGLMERLNPQLQLENERVRQRLADQGIRPGAGMDAYDAGMDVYNRQANDARLAVIGQAGQEQARMDEMAARRAGFQNAAQQQAYTQNQQLAAFGNQAQAQAEQQAAARGAFYNQAAESMFGQAAARGQFYNQAQNQLLGRNQAIFNAQNQLRNQALQEAYQQRQQPINEITALMSGSQVQQPNWINAARTQIPTTDVAGLINQNFAQQNDIYKSQTGFWGDIFGGALGFGGQVARANPGFLSDRRAKEEIEPMGAVFGNGKKLPIYEYQYKGDPSETRHTGPMAQDVEKLDPSAVAEIGGLKHIKLDRMGSIFGRG